MQQLKLIRGDGQPTTVAQFETSRDTPFYGILCPFFGAGGLGRTSVVAGVFQRLAVSPDGGTVVFEVSDSFTPLDPAPQLGDENTGIFVVNSDGSGLRRLGPASGVKPYAVFLDFASTTPLQVASLDNFAFSPDGRQVAFADRLDGPQGAADQIVVLDVRSGRRRAVTNLPPSSLVAKGIGTPPIPADVFGRYIDTKSVLTATTFGAVFISSTRLAFNTLANPDNLNPEENFASFAVNLDGTDLRIGGLDKPAIKPSDSQIAPAYGIAGADPVAVVSFVVDPPGGDESFPEVVLVDGEQSLELTHFRRYDTGSGDQQMVYSQTLGRVFFPASVDVDPTTSQCQMFSVSSRGSDLRQLTHFRSSTGSTGCSFIQQPSCAMSAVGISEPARELIFYSSCEPDGSTSARSAQVYSLALDQAPPAVRALTDTEGSEAGGRHVQLPGPIAYSAGGR